MKIMIGYISSRSVSSSEGHSLASLWSNRQVQHPALCGGDIARVAFACQPKHRLPGLRSDNHDYHLALPAANACLGRFCSWEAPRLKCLEGCSPLSLASSRLLGRMSSFRGLPERPNGISAGDGKTAAVEAGGKPNLTNVDPPLDSQNPTTNDLPTTASIPGVLCSRMKTVGKSTNIVWQECMVKKEEKQKLLRQRGCVIWITGLSGSGKSTLACTLDHLLLKRGNLSYVLDGDNLRHGLNKNLGFSVEDRAENIRRVGEVAKLFVDAGIICIASLISPYRKDRVACRQLLQDGEFIEVHMNFPLMMCEERDPKGLYKLARAGKIKGFTGVDDPYEAPLDCEVVMEPIEGRCPTPAEMAAHLVSYLEERGFLGTPC